MAQTIQVKKSRTNPSARTTRGVARGKGYKHPFLRTRRILDYSEKKLSKTAKDIVLCKLISVVSAFLINGSNCSIMFVAPPSSWKSQTSSILEEVLAKNTLLEMESETWKAVMQELQKFNGRNLCILINDMTEISENRTAKEMREIKGGLTRLLIDRKYRYKNMAMPKPIRVKVKGISCIVNMVPYTHKRMTASGINSTFFERFLRLAYEIPSTEKANWRRYEDVKRKLVYKGPKLKLKPFTVKMSDDIREKLDRLIETLTSEQRNPYSDRLSDYFCSAAKCHAHLWSRTEVTTKDFEYVEKTIFPMLKAALTEEAK